MMTPRSAVAHPHWNAFKPLRVNYKELVTDRYTQYTKGLKEHLAEQIQDMMASAAPFDESRLSHRPIPLAAPRRPAEETSHCPHGCWLVAYPARHGTMPVV